MRHFRRKISKNSSKVFVLFTEILSKRLIYLLIGNLKTFEYSKKLFPFLLAASFSLNDREKRCLLFQNFPIYHRPMIIIPVITVHRTTLRGSRDAENFPETIKCLVSVLNSSWTKWRERGGEEKHTPWKKETLLESNSGGIGCVGKTKRSRNLQASWRFSSTPDGKATDTRRNFLFTSKGEDWKKFSMDTLYF